ncbi:MAG: ethanolamine utilization protein EutN [Alphaproteobacteria bacterium]|nr:ethanolamine utilization protein EutN [Alphaproteobacteria bacterium]
MIRGHVVGSVWATKRLESIPAGAFLEVETAGGGCLVAFDVLGCGEGEEVLIVSGSTAAAWLGGGKIPIDALIIGSIDHRGGESPPARSGSRK